LLLAAQSDLAPLPKVLKEGQQKEQEQQQQQEQADAASTTAAAAKAAAAAKPVLVPEVLSEDANEHWRLTDSIIMNVLRRY
jgi:hypothetical protein